MMPNALKRRALCLLALLSISLSACSQSPQYTGVPEGLDRNAKPRMIFTKDADLLDDMPLKIDIAMTTTSNAFLGCAREKKDPFIDPFFNRTGINFLVSSETDTRSHPGVLGQFSIWVGQKKGSSKFMPCTTEEWTP